MTYGFFVPKTVNFSDWPLQIGTASIALQRRGIESGTIGEPIRHAAVDLSDTNATWISRKE